VSWRGAARKLFQLRQDSLSVADYAVEYRTIAHTHIALNIRINGSLQERRREKRSDCCSIRSLKDPTLHLMNSGSPRCLDA
jgi:hypothetical protein